MKHTPHAGHLAIVGLGPGSRDLVTPRAMQMLLACDLVVDILSQVQEETLGNPSASSTEKMPEPLVEIVPGISALNAAAALLGAPLMHDFAVISLSDLLTPWQTIAHRLSAAAAADFVV